jgi:hypothetical protein
MPLKESNSKLHNKKSSLCIKIVNLTPEAIINQSNLIFQLKIPL